MLGLLAEEDTAQDYPRWYSADCPFVENPRAFLAKIVTRLGLDRLWSMTVLGHTLKPRHDIGKQRTSGVVARIVRVPDWMNQATLSFASQRGSAALKYYAGQ